MQIIPGVEAPQPIELSAPAERNLFSYSRRQQLPTPHTKVDSWLTPSVSWQRKLLLVLQIRKVRSRVSSDVRDNTRGPDGQSPRTVRGVEKMDSRRDDGSYEQSPDGSILLTMRFFQASPMADSNAMHFAAVRTSHALRLGVTRSHWITTRNYSERRSMGERN